MRFFHYHLALSRHLYPTGESAHAHSLSYALLHHVCWCSHPLALSWNYSNIKLLAREVLSVSARNTIKNTSLIINIFLFLTFLLTFCLYMVIFTCSLTKQITLTNRKQTAMNKILSLGLAVVSLVALSACHHHHHFRGNYGGYHHAAPVMHHNVHHHAVHAPHRPHR